MLAVLLSVMLVVLSEPMLLLAQEDDGESAHRAAREFRPELINSMGDRTSLSADTLKAVYDFGPPWLNGVNGAFIGWKVGGQIDAGDYSGALKTFATFGYESYFVANIPVMGQIYAGLKVYSAAVKWLINKLDMHIHDRVWATYVNERSGGISDEQAWEMTMAQSVSWMGNIDVYLRDKNVTEEQLHSNFLQRYEVEHGSGRSMRNMSDEALQEYAMRLETHPMKVIITVVSLSDGKPIRGADIQVDHSDFTVVNNGDGTYTCTILLGNLNPDYRHTFTVSYRGETKRRWLTGRTIIEYIFGRRMLRGEYIRRTEECRLTVELDGEEEPTGGLMGDMGGVSWQWDNTPTPGAERFTFTYPPSGHIFLEQSGLIQGTVSGVPDGTRIVIRNRDFSDVAPDRTYRVRVENSAFEQNIRLHPSGSINVITAELQDGSAISDQLSVNSPPTKYYPADMNWSGGGVSGKCWLDIDFTGGEFTGALGVRNNQIATAAGNASGNCQGGGITGLILFRAPEWENAVQGEIRATYTYVGKPKIISVNGFFSVPETEETPAVEGYFGQ